MKVVFLNLLNIMKMLLIKFRNHSSMMKATSFTKVIKNEMYLTP